MKAHPQEEDDEVNDDEDLQDNIKPDDSASNHGSTASSVHSKRALNIARLKGLQVQKEALEKEHQLKQRLLEQEENARREKEQLTAELERAKLETEMNTLMAEKTHWLSSTLAKNLSPRRLVMSHRSALMNFCKLQANLQPTMTTSNRSYKSLMVLRQRCRRHNKNQQNKLLLHSLNKRYPLPVFYCNNKCST